MDRRQFLLATTTAVTGVSGCSALDSPSPSLSVTIFNHTDSPYTVEVGIFRLDGDSSRSDARAYSGSIDVLPDGRADRENVAEARPYLVEYHAYEDNRKPTDEDHVHYLPPDDGEDDALAFDIHDDGTLTRR